jgi:hypothetical protein
MTKRIGIREVTRNFSILDDYDYVEIEDKKTHKVKGLFVSEKFLDDVKEFLEAKKAAEIQEQLDEIRQFAGKGKIHERFNGLTSREIREKIAKEKYG